jgi:hypothetical protein
MMVVEGLVQKFQAYRELEVVVRLETWRLQRDHQASSLF